MAFNTAVAYAQAAVERFKRGSLTDAVMSAGYDWTSSKSVVLTTNDLGTVGDYTRTGVSRYGAPTELGNTQQTLIVTKDRSFTYTIDKRGRQEAAMTNDAASTLARTIDQVIKPEIDVYRLAACLAATPVAHIPLPAAITKTNAYTSVLALNELLDEDRIPNDGRILFATPAALNFLKQDANFTKPSDMGMALAIKGQVGEVDGVPVIKVASSIMPLNTAFMLVHKDAIAAPVVLEEYKTHIDPPGISGWLIEGRFVYDAFVVTTLNNAFAAWKIA